MPSAGKQVQRLGALWCVRIGPGSMLHQWLLPSSPHKSRFHSFLTQRHLHLNDWALSELNWAKHHLKSTMRLFGGPDCETLNGANGRNSSFIWTLGTLGTLSTLLSKMGKLRPTTIRFNNEPNCQPLALFLLCRSCPLPPLPASAYELLTSPSPSCSHC